jgi:uncharacterized membrane protein YphA (DoxX/SURF4 family)
MRWIILLQVALGVTLLAAGLSKIITRSSLRPFLDALGLPPRLSVAASDAVPVLELCCGATLLAGVPVWPAAGAAVLTVLFTATLGVAWRAGVLEGCRCFGSLDRGSLSPVSLARAAGLAVASLVLLGFHLHGPAGVTWLAADGGTALALLLGIGFAAAYLTAFALVEEVWRFQRQRLPAASKRFAADRRRPAPALTQQATTREEIR